MQPLKPMLRKWYLLNLYKLFIPICAKTSDKSIKYHIINWFKQILIPSLAQKSSVQYNNLPLKSTSLVDLHTSDGRTDRLSLKWEVCDNLIQRGQRNFPLGVPGKALMGCDEVLSWRKILIHGMRYPVLCCMWHIIGLTMVFNLVRLEQYISHIKD